jgi:hypothetical protein
MSEKQQLALLMALSLKPASEAEGVVKTAIKAMGLNSYDYTPNVGAEMLKALEERKEGESVHSKLCALEFFDAEVRFLLSATPEDYTLGMDYLKAVIRPR